MIDRHSLSRFLCYILLQLHHSYLCFANNTNLNMLTLSIPEHKPTQHTYGDHCCCQITFLSSITNNFFAQFLVPFDPISIVSTRFCRDCRRDYLNRNNFFFFVKSVWVNADCGFKARAKGHFCELHFSHAKFGHEKISHADSTETRNFLVRNQYTYQLKKSE